MPNSVSQTLTVVFLPENITTASNMPNETIKLKCIPDTYKFRTASSTLAYSSVKIFLQNSLPLQYVNWTSKSMAFESVKFIFRSESSIVTPFNCPTFLVTCVCNLFPLIWRPESQSSNDRRILSWSRNNPISVAECS